MAHTIIVYILYIGRHYFFNVWAINTFAGLYVVEKGAGSVLWQDEMAARGGSDVSIDLGGAGAHFQQDQLQLIDDQVVCSCLLLYSLSMY